jgi:hyperosmotically inducible periplasmic protein
MKRRLTSAIALSVLSTVPLFAQDQQRPATPDDRIYDQVRMRLSTDPDVKGGALDVHVKDGVVTLTGRVDSDKGKSKATKLTKKIKGVKSVDNELSVGPPA